MYQNATYIYISWYSKICWFPMKKCWCQQNSRSVSRDSHNFWIFLRLGITVPSFIIAGYVWQILGRGTFLSPPIREQPQETLFWIDLKLILSSFDQKFLVINSTVRCPHILCAIWYCRFLLVLKLILS